MTVAGHAAEGSVAVPEQAHDAGVARAGPGHGATVPGAQRQRRRERGGVGVELGGLSLDGDKGAVHDALEREGINVAQVRIHGDEKRERVGGSRRRDCRADVGELGRAEPVRHGGDDELADVDGMGPGAVGAHAGTRPAAAHVADGERVLVGDAKGEVGGSGNGGLVAHQAHGGALLWIVGGDMTAQPLQPGGRLPRRRGTRAGSCPRASRT